MSPARLASSVVALALSLAVSAPSGTGVAAAEEGAKTIRVGIIGLDTSHVVAFTKVLNGAKAQGDLAGVRVVAAYPGGSPDVAVEPRPRRRLHRGAARQVQGRDRRFDRRPADAGRRGAPGERRRPASPGPGPGRSSGAQAGLHRQAARRLAGRRGRDRPARRGNADALLLELLAPLQPGPRSRSRTTPRSARSRVARRTVPARSRNITPTCSGTASTASRCSTP